MKNSSAPGGTHQILQTLMQKDSVTVHVCGMCMAPLITADAQLRVRRRRIYLPGDIVVFTTADNRYLVHRIIGLYRKGGRWKYLTQADNCARPDAAIGQDALLGRVTAGDCLTQAVRVPLFHRLRALARFFHFAAEQAYNMHRLS